MAAANGDRTDLYFPSFFFFPYYISLAQDITDCCINREPQDESDTDELNPFLGLRRKGMPKDTLNSEDEELTPSRPV